MRAVIRSSAFQRPMRALALAAVLLLALMPSAARLLASRAATGAQAGWTELCTMAGLKLGRGSPDAQIARPAVVLDRLGRWGYSCREASHIAGRDVAQFALISNAARSAYE